MSPGLGFEEALDVVRVRALAPAPEVVPVEDAVGRRLSEPVLALVDLPAFTASAMDGYALRAGDAPGRLRLVGESRAGAPWTGFLATGQAVRISTGAELPEGADAVLRREDAAEEDGVLVVSGPVAPGHDVRRRGEDVARGGVVLPAGAVLAAHEVVAIAGAGHAVVTCARRPRVAVLASGDELVPPGEELGPGQIYDGNRLGIGAQIAAAGGEVASSDVVRDDRAVTEAAVAGLLDSGVDLLVTIGGVSVGRHDHLRPALAAAGVEEIFWGVEIRPGHPLWLGARGGQMVMGLPGNPVSAAVCMHLFGRPLLGRDESWQHTAPMAVDVAKTTRRADFLRCREEAGALVPLPNQGSHALSSLAGATALAWIPAGDSDVAAGEHVRYAPLAGL